MCSSRARRLGFSCGSRRAYSSRLASRFSKIASMTTSACATPRPSTSALQPRHRLLALRGIGIALLEELARAFHAPASTYSSARSCSVTVRPRAAHHAAMSPPITPAPTTCTCFAAGSPSPCRRLQALLQKKHAHEIARGWRAQQLRHRPCFGLVRALSLAAIALPQIDQGVGGRVVVRADSLRDLRTHLSREDRAHQCGIEQAILERERSLAAADSMRLAGPRSQVDRGGASRSTRPSASACLGRIERPVSIRSMAAIGPASCTARTVPPRPG